VLAVCLAVLIPVVATAEEKAIGPYALVDAVLERDVAKVRELVGQGADIHALDTRPEVAGSNGRRPLNWAALQNDVPMIEALLELGADINRQNLSGFTPLHHAVEADAADAIALLVRRGADTTSKNRRDLTPAELATALGNAKAAAALTEALAKTP
jgi:ankyrin repeat protein